jgi:DNA helicase HerA-like ATPase
MVFEEQGYVGESRNLAAALRVRLSSLLRGNRGRMLDTVESIDFDALMRYPTIIELDAIADPEDKAVLSMLLLDRIRAAGRARSSSGGQLRHVTVLEEAHRLLSAAHEQSSGNYEANPRAEGVRAFCEAIAEMRASGEGFILSSQRASELASTAVANCGTRIIHRLESHDDREVVLNDLDASPLDRQAAARLRRGEAVMRWSEQDEAEVVQTLPPPDVDSGATVEDSRVADSMVAITTKVRRLLPYPLCTRDVCTQGCDLQRRSRGREVARKVGPDVRPLWAEAKRTIDTLDPVARALADEAEGDVELAYCGAVHLAINGDALTVRKPVDIRPKLATAIRKAVERG